VHIAYLDDSQQQGSVVIFGAVLIPHGNFGWAERMHSIAIEQLFTADEIEEKFQEFHAYELFKGEGAFKAIDEARRFDAISVLLMAITDYKLPFIYAAIDEKKLAKSQASRSLLETAHPLIPAFKMCVLGVEQWAQDQHSQGQQGIVKVNYNDQYVLIADETKDQELKKGLRKSYRLLRAVRPYLRNAQNRLWHAHDAMYFGDSKESVGIQLADLCAYFVRRRLSRANIQNKDEGDLFYDMFASQVICAKPEPEWTEHRELFLSLGE
jgi:hypothetical protein